MPIQTKFVLSCIEKLRALFLVPLFVYIWNLDSSAIMKPVVNFSPGEDIGESEEAAFDVKWSKL